MLQKFTIPQAFILLLTILMLGCQSNKQSSSLLSSTSYVDPMIGTGGHGHTFPGATLPFGMIQLSPDNGISGWDWCSGYHFSDSITIGFSHLHLSGTGIGDLGDIRFMPINKKVDLTEMNDLNEDYHRNNIPFKSRYSHEGEFASPGYYKVKLIDHDIITELTAGLRTGHHRYEFLKSSEQSVIIDLGFTFNWDKTLESAIFIENKNTISGYRHSKGWADNQKVFFTATFSKPIKNVELFADSSYVRNDKEVEGTNTTAQLFFEPGNNSQLEATVSVSSVSIENAKTNLENSPYTDFDTVKKEAQQQWESNLSRIKVESSVDSLKTIFYTALYHALVAPVTFSDYNGQIRKENDVITDPQENTIYSTLSLWDTFRAEHPLLTILEPGRVIDIIKSFLVYYEERKILPVWTLYGNETNTMTGYHSIPVIAEAYFKGIQDFDVEVAYEAMKTTMMQDERGLIHYKKHGYIPYDSLDESVTITLEFAYNDWCVAQMAQALGKEDDYEYFFNRSKAYHHIFDKNTGFMRGKSADGKTWNTPFDPKFSSHRKHTDYTEGNAWQHSWFVLHDVEDLIKMHGGDKLFTEKLEQLFTESSEITGENVSADISGLIGQYAHGNEPSHHIAYMFNFANQPWRTQYWVRQILKTQYNTTPDGLSGNEDCGQMSAWYVFSSIGLYPYNPASATYQIGSPIFDEVSIQVSEREFFTITADNVSEKNMYIQSATLNGKPYNSTLLSHSQILQGGKLHFIMGPVPNKSWGVKQ